MPERLTFTVGARGSRGRQKTIIARLSESGDVVGRSEQFFDSDAHFVVAARFLCMPPRQIAALYERHVKEGIDSIDLGGPSPRKRELVPVTVRGLMSGQRQEYDSFWSAHNACAGDQGKTIEWSGVEEMAVLDLDFHASFVPDRADVMAAGDLLSPVPIRWWLSRSGGLHALYCSLDGVGADELAACAALWLQERFAGSRSEIKSATRPAPGDVVCCVPTSDCRHLHRLHARVSCDEAVAAEWLEDRGLEVGKRYPHDRCPVNPSRRAEGNSPPVVVYADHIYCHICAADGVRKGSRGVGYFPIQKLAGRTEATMFRRCVENFTHWDHAKYIVGQLVNGEQMARTVYRAALRQLHGDDPRVPRAFSSCPKTGLVRYDGYWSGASGRVKKYDRQSPVLAGLPVAQYVDEDGEVKTDMKVVEELASTDDLAPYGYPALTRVWGVQLTKLQDLPDNRVFAVLQRNGDPQYLPSARRMPEDAAWQVLERHFPGLNRPAIELLIAAKGCSEHRTGLPPMVFFTGPTGAGKTQTVDLAASICGDRATRVIFHQDQDRVRRGVLKAKEAGSFAFFDEYLKAAKSWRTPPDDAMEFLLGLDPDSVSHVLYVGAVALGDLPVCVWADTELPPEVCGHAQIGRRVHHVPLLEAKEGWSPAKDLRGLGSEVAAAGDSILSCVVDRWFSPGPGTDFADVAAALGFKLLRDSGAGEEKANLIRRLFALACMAPPITGGLKKRWPDRGWVAVNLSADSDELTLAWKFLADRNDHGQSRSVSECDLKRVLGLAHPAKLEVSRFGNHVAIRFASGDKYNAELELAAGAAGVHGPGDAVGDRPQEDG